MKVLSRKSYRLSFLFLVVTYLIIAILISGFYNTLPLVIKYARTVNWLELGLSVGFSIIIALLVAANAITAYVRYQQRKACKNETTVATIGTVSGLAAGICPLCVTGLFPLILGLFGITFSFATLPFKGLEVQALSILLLSLSLWMLLRRRSSTKFK